MRAPWFVFIGSKIAGMRIYRGKPTNWQ